MVRAAAICNLCKVFLTERLLTVSVVNTDSELIDCRLCSINTLNHETLGPTGFRSP